MASLKEIFERAQQTGQVEYTYFGGTNVSPFNQTSIPVYPGTNKKLNSQSPYIRLGYEGGFPGDAKFRTSDPAGIYNTGLAAVRDTARIGAFFTDIPNGPLWLLKQTGLQLSNPDTSFSTVLTDGTSTSNNKLQQLQGPRFYNPVGTNTLASVAGNALGLHFTRHGLSPVDESGYISANTLNTQEGQTFQSRLTDYKSKLLNNSPSQEILLNNYVGGPSSFYGIGRTRTFSYVNQQTPNYLNANNNNFNPFTFSDIEIYSNQVKQGLNVERITETVRVPVVPLSDPNDLSVPDNLFTTETVTRNLKLPGNGYIQDFRQVNDNINSTNYPVLNLHSRIGMTTGKVAVGNPNTVDSINILKITPSQTFYANSNTAMGNIPTDLIYTKGYDATKTKDKVLGYYGRDIIRFRIEVLNNDAPTFETKNTAGDIVNRGVNTDVLAFRAYLESLDDQFSPTWKEFNYMGRGEPFYVYEKFKRTVNLSFNILAHSGEEMAIIYSKLNYLMSAMTPDYNQKLQMRGNYIYLTIGEYIYRQPGVVTNLQIQDLLKAPWEIAVKDPENRGKGLEAIYDGNNNITNEDNLHYEIPKFMKVSMTFNPIHDFLPRRVYAPESNAKYSDWKATFVTPNHNIYYTPSNVSDDTYNKYLPSSNSPNPLPPKAN
jgi:hypothetical protein